MLPEISVELEWRGKRYRDVSRGIAAFTQDVEENLNAWLPIVRKELRNYMTGVVTSVRDRTTTPYPGGTSAAGTFPGTLSKRSGALSRSLSPQRIEIKGDDVKETTVSFRLTGIAVVHEQGATIRPKSAQYLTIPLPAALNPNGTPKRRSARDWQNTFVQRSKKGNLLIFQKGRGGNLVPLYVLKKQVRIPKRLAFEEAFEAGRDFLADRIAAEIVKEFNTLG